MTLDLLRIRDVCAIEKGGVNPQNHPEERFVHYSIPAFDDGQAPVLEHGLAIKSNKTRISRGVVLVSKLNPRIPRVWFVNDDHTLQRICSTEFVPFRPDTSKLEPDYLAFALRRLLKGGQITGSTSAATKSRERAKPSEIADLRIPVPPLDEQRRIVDLLSRAEGIVRLRREAQAKAAEIIPALFLDMFGDPATNPKGWPEAQLGALSDIQGGLQLSQARATLPLERPYLRVANVHRSRLDLSEVKTMRITETEFERTRLQRGDLLVVEGHGNANEIGRVGVWDGSIDDCVHQNHLIRVRCHAEALKPEFASAYLNSASGRRALLRSGKTTSGLNTISVSNVKTALMFVPPLDAQAKFEDQCQSVLGVIAQQSEALANAGEAFQTVLVQAFSGDGKPAASSARIGSVVAA